MTCYTAVLLDGALLQTLFLLFRTLFLYALSWLRAALLVLVLLLGGNDVVRLLFRRSGMLRLRRLGFLLG